ncbi:hypothetical protein [Lentibacillus sp. Marseille-P4043]|uniref:hypothetical protein n=1 Tax=Lentibacillus sp. Marseille-P4043 TaxID=2040293 RepID=UPI000D0B3613|nr:hypothetical protein [Lentibacillus sp. Marseille-P4043]
MGFAVFFLASWLIVAIFVVLPKKLSIIENTVIFLVLLIIIINASWIIIEELKLIKETQEGIKYVAYLLNRSVIIPMTLITQLNIIHQSNTPLKFILTITVSLVFLLGLRALSLYFDIISYVKWNFGYDVIYILILHLITYYAYQLFKKLAQSEVDIS